MNVDDQHGSSIHLENQPDLMSGVRSRDGVAGGPSDDDGDYVGRDERRSPAAVLGSKRVGVVVLPQALNNAVQHEINGEPSNTLYMGH